MLGQLFFRGQNKTRIYESVSISRLSTYTKEGCTLPQVGGRWTISVATGAYTSEISQEDADTQANSYANSLDTQANANAYGSCVAAEYYWVSTTPPLANFRFYITTGATTYWRMSGDYTTALISTNTNHDIQNSGSCYLSYYFSNITASYRIYVNGVLTSSGDNVTATGSGSWRYFCAIPTVSAGDMVYVKIY